jgi:hypothetical protein
MARYDAGAQLWIRRADRWNVVLQQAQLTHTLPPPEQVGLPAAAEK